METIISYKLSFIGILKQLVFNNVLAPSAHGTSIVRVIYIAPEVPNQSCMTRFETNFNDFYFQMLE